MKRILLYVALLSVMVFGFSTISLAETIVLKSGKIIEGRIVEQKDEYIKIDFNGIPVVYFLEKIATINGEDSALSNASKSGVVKSSNQEDILKETLELCGLKQQIDSMLAAIELQMTQHNINLDSETDELIRKVIKEAYTEQTVYKIIFNDLLSHFDEARFVRISNWYRSTLAKKISQLEIQSSTPEAIEQMRQFAVDLQSVPPAQERIDLIQKFDSISGVSDFAVEIISEVSLQILMAVQMALPEDQKVQEKDWETKLKSEMISRMKEPMKQQIELSLLFAYRSLSAQELKEYMDFLQSDDNQWFDKIAKNALLGSLAKIGIEIGDILAVNVGFGLDVAKILEEEILPPTSPAWYIPYYYRAKENDRIIPILKDVLTMKNILGNSLHSSPLIHFFAAVIRENSAIQSQIETLKASYVGQELEFIENILQEIRDFKPAGLDSPGSVDRAWAEFYASGDEKIIQNMIAFLEQEKDKQLEQAVEVSLVKAAAKDRKVRESIKKISENTSAASNVNKKIDKVITFMDAFVKESERLWEQGRNYATLNKEDATLKSYDKALTFNADSPGIYYNISLIFDQHKDYEKAMLYTQTALYLDPAYGSALYNMGRYSALKDLQDEAISYYLKALEYKPKDIDIIYSLGAAYYNKRDQANAVKYFTTYLESEPNGRYAQKVRGYLQELGGAVPEDAGPLSMLRAKRFKDLEQYLTPLLINKTKDDDGRSLLANAYKEITKLNHPPSSHKQDLPLMEEWMKQYPDSHFAHACLGWFYVEYAWAARGNGFADTLVEEGKQLFKERLLKGKEYLEKAYLLDPSDAVVASRLITVSKSLGEEREEMEKQFQKAVQADPEEYNAYNQKLEYLMDKWYGSDEEMFEFARESARNAAPHSLIPQILIAAHRERHYRTEDGTYFKTPGVWEEIHPIYMQLVQDFPNSSRIRNWYAKTAYLAGDYATAKEQFAIIQDDWNKDAWSSPQEFEKVKNEVQNK